MAFNTDKLSYLHSFSKMPVQSGSNFADGTTLGNAINKSGHTVTATEVWANDIPYYGKMGSLDDVKTKVQPYARKNDLCYITAGDDKGKTFIYDGEGNWTQITLTAGMLLKNSKDENVLLYHKGETLTNLTADNNANTDSADNAARLWTTIGKDGQECEKRLVEQFVAPTDKALNGLASVAFAPSIADGTLVSGTNYYDYCFSGTILWATKRTTATVIDCFEYVGEKVSDVVDTVGTHTDEIKSAKDAIATINEQLGLGNTGEEGATESLGGRVSSLEETVGTLTSDATVEGSVAHSVKGLADTTVTSESTSEDTHVTVTLGGSVGAPTVTVTTSDIASASALKTLSEKVDTLHKAGVSYKVLESLPEASAEYNGYIVLIPETEEDGTTVVSDEFVEWLCVNKGTETEPVYEWERIGTTKTDLSEYATTASVTEAIGELETSLVGETGKVTVLQGKVKDIEETTVPALEQAIADAESAAKSHAEDQAGAAQEAAEAAAAKALSEAKEELEGKIADAQSAGETAAAEALAAAQTAQQTAEAKISSVTEGTDSSLLTVSTEGTAVTITLDGDVATKTDISETALTGSGESTDKFVKVTLGGTLGEQTVTVETKDIASAAALTALENTVNSHIEAAAGLYLSVEKVDTLPATGETNKVYLVPLDTEEGREKNIHTEYIWTNGAWQVIGTTAIDINSLEKAAQTAQAAADKAQAEVDELETVVSTLSQTVAANQIAAEEATDALASRLTTAEGEIDTLQSQVEALTTGDAQAITTVTGDTYVKATKSGSTVTLETQIRAIDTELAKTTSTVGGLIKKAQDAADQAQKEVDELEGIVVTLTETVANNKAALEAQITAVSEVVVSNKAELVASITALDTRVTALESAQSADKAALEQGISEAKAAAQAAHEAANTAKQTADGKVASVTITDTTGTITQTGTSTAPAFTVSAGSVASGESKLVSGGAVYTAIDDLKTTKVADNQTVTGAGISVTLGGTVGTPTLTGSVATASYTQTVRDAEGNVTTEGSWDTATIGNIVTGEQVKNAIHDVATAHDKDIETLTQAITGLTTTGLTREVVAEGTKKEDIENPQPNIIYLIKDETSETGDYVEYLYVNGTWEAIGTTSTDLAEYAKSDDVTAKIDGLTASPSVNGLTVTQVKGTITEVTETLIAAEVPAGTTSVVNNVAYVGSEKHVIAPEKFQTSAQMPTSLTSWVADLPNLTVGDGMFNGCSGLTTFIGDLGALTSGVNMFAGCQLSVESVEFIADTLPTIERGTGTITLGTTTEAHAEAIAEIEAKGWAVA